MRSALSLIIAAFAVVTAIWLALPRSAAVTREAEPFVPPAVPIDVPSEPIAVHNCPCGPSCSCVDCRCNDYAAAREKAARENLSVLVVLSTDPCAPCRDLERTLAALDLKGVVVCKIDSAKRPDLVAAFAVQRFPTLVLSHPGGATERLRREGVVDKATLLELLKPPVTNQPVQVTPAWQVTPASVTQPVSRGFVFRSSGGC